MIEHKKMYKKGRHWVIAIMTTLGVATGVSFGMSSMAHADTTDSSTPAPVEQTTPTNSDGSSDITGDTAVLKNTTDLKTNTGVSTDSSNVKEDTNLQADSNGSYTLVKQASVSVKTVQSEPVTRAVSGLTDGNQVADPTKVYLTGHVYLVGNGNYIDTGFTGISAPSDVISGFKNWNDISNYLVSSGSYNIVPIIRTVSNYANGTIDAEIAISELNEFFGAIGGGFNKEALDGMVEVFFKPFIGYSIDENSLQERLNAPITITDNTVKPDLEIPFVKNDSQVTIHYVKSNGEKAFEDRIVKGYQGQAVAPIDSPTLSGYTADQTSVTVNFDGTDHEITVTYTPTPVVNPGDGGTVPEQPIQPEQPERPTSPEVTPPVNKPTPKPIPTHKPAVDNKKTQVSGRSSIAITKVTVEHVNDGRSTQSQKQDPVEKAAMLPQTGESQSSEASMGISLLGLLGVFGLLGLKKRKHD